MTVEEEAEKKKISERRKKLWRELFDDGALKDEELERHHEEADFLRRFLNEPQHEEPKQRYDWEQDLEEQVEKLSPKKEEEEEEND